VRAAFLDRDGVINKLIYHHEHGIVDSPFTVEQFSLISGADEAMRRLHENGYKIILVSNQPGIAKGYLSEETFEEIRTRMNRMLAVAGVKLDAEYYCFHHPEAVVPELRTTCKCRKPGPGLLFRAAGEMDIDLAKSWMIGDGITDIQAGKRAGCRTILIGRMKCELCELMDKHNARPDFIAPNLREAARYILTKGDQRWKSSLIRQVSTISKNG
jgi:D-glycero-D-manno-heptose 1,7-bisphosphate phosphatase